MPYVDIKCFPRNEEMRRDIVEKINQVLIDAWGCKPETISISLEEVEPENWDAQVKETEMDARADSMFILHGEKKY
jgi:4-oxalocrotonate tautomerase